MKQSENFINLEKLAGGAFAEKLNEALLQVAENIQNPNTEATVKRGITVNIKFAPNKNRQLVNTTISVTTKLAATEAIDTQMLMGTNLKTGQIEIAEYNGQIRGQVMLADLTQPTEEPDTTTEAENTQQPSGKPLDLRNRGKKQDTMEPGVDFDPTTGEVFDGDTPTTNAKVVPINKEAAQA